LAGCSPSRPGPPRGRTSRSAGQRSLIPGTWARPRRSPSWRSSEDAAPGIPSITTTLLCRRAPWPPTRALATDDDVVGPDVRGDLGAGDGAAGASQTGIPASAALFRTAAAPSWVALMMITSTFFWIRVLPRPRSASPAYPRRSGWWPPPLRLSFVPDAVRHGLVEGVDLVGHREADLDGCLRPGGQEARSPPRQDRDTDVCAILGWPIRLLLSRSADPTPTMGRVVPRPSLTGC